MIVIMFQASIFLVKKNVRNIINISNVVVKQYVFNKCLYYRPDTLKQTNILNGCNNILPAILFRLRTEKTFGLETQKREENYMNYVRNMNNIRQH